MKDDLIAQARSVLARNDRGHYTVPTHGLYPFQWNWDSALSALGFAHFDEDRAWSEIDTLFQHQWEDGTVPHIIFHELDDGYFPGPDVWGTGRQVPTSGITQPPVSGFAVRRIFDRARNPAMAEQRVRALLPRIHAWHEWFYRYRDPEGTGLVAIIHPWESGRDNSVDWDAALARVPTDGVAAFQRRDTKHTNPAHRPTDDQYNRYIWLVQHFRKHGWDNATLHDVSPFQMVDPGFNSILIRSCSDLADLAEQLGESAIAAQSRAFAKRGIEAMDALWNAKLGQYSCYDRIACRLTDIASIAGLLPVFCAIPKHRADAIALRIDKLAESARYMVPSQDPTTPQYDGLRYWRGPVWLIMNYMISVGLAAAGQTVLARRIEDDSINLIEKSGFAEYYDPTTAEPCGGGEFTWTAAMVIEILSARSVPA